MINFLILLIGQLSSVFFIIVKGLYKGEEFQKFDYLSSVELNNFVICFSFVDYCLQKINAESMVNIQLAL